MFSLITVSRKIRLIKTAGRFLPAGYIVILMCSFAANGWAASSAAVGEDPAEAKVMTLDEIVVTATRTERNASEVPASVSIIDSQAIQDSKMMNIKDAIMGTPGVLIEAKNQGYDARLMIRGAGLKSRYGIRDIMVLMDGVPITDPDSLTRLDFIDTQLIDQVEIVKGPNSTLWGANAAGGVINIITRSPMEGEGGILKAGAGSFDTYSTHLSYSGKAGDKAHYTISGSHRRSDNSWRRWNDFSTSQGTFQGAYVLDNGTIADAHLGYTQSDLQLPGKLDEGMFERYKDSGKAKETEGPWQHSGRYSEIFFVNIRLQKQVGAFEFKPMVYLNSWSHYHPVTGRIGEADTSTFGTDLQINHSHLLFGMPGETATGVSIRRDDQKTDYFQYRSLVTAGGRITSTLSDEKGALSEKQTRKADLYGIYFQETLTIRDHLICDIGIRFDQVKFDIGGTTHSEYNYRTGAYVTSEGAYATRTTYDSISPRLGLVYKLTGGLNVYAAAAKGIKTPTESEINDNPDLKLPEIYNYETGLKFRSKKWSMDAAVYYSTEDDEVIQVIQENNQTDYVNAGRTIKKGAELAVTVTFPFYLNAGLNYSYTHYTFDKFLEPVRVGPTPVNMDRSGNFLPLIPTHQYALIFGFRHPDGYKFKAKSFYWGEYYMDNANTEKYNGYALITNLMLGYEQPQWEVNLMVDNLFDKKYAVETAKDTSGEKSYVPAAPFSMMANVVVKF